MQRFSRIFPALALGLVACAGAAPPSKDEGAKEAARLILDQGEAVAQALQGEFGRGGGNFLAFVGNNFLQDVGGGGH